MFPHPDTVIRVTEARHREALDAAARDRLLDDARAAAGPRPVVAIALRAALGAALVRIGERPNSPSHAAAPGGVPAQ